MSAVRIGPYTLQNGLILAPMAGVTDQPFRQLCKRLGAGLVVSEMVTSDMSLWNSRKSRLRMIHEGDPEPRSVQIAGGDPRMLADAARANVELGAAELGGTPDVAPGPYVMLAIRDSGTGIAP